MDRDLDYVVKLGRPFIAHRLRRLAELFLEGYSQWLPSVGVSAPARSLSTLLLLSEAGPLGVTELAARLRLSHPLMIKLVAKLEDAGLARVEQDTEDARRRPLRLTVEGEAEASRIKEAVRALDRAFAELFAETEVNLPESVSRLEDACLRDSFARRLERARQQLSTRKKEVTCS